MYECEDQGQPLQARSGGCDRAAFCFGTACNDKEMIVNRAGRRAEPGLVNIALLCDQPLLRSSLRALIESRHGYQVPMESVTCHCALEFAAGLAIDVAIVELDLTESAPHGAEELEKMLSTGRTLPILIVTRDPDTAMCRAALRAGAKGILLKHKTSDELFGAIDRVQRGENWLEGLALEKLFAPDAKAAPRSAEGDSIALLTRRELEVVRAVARGITNKEVGDALFISGATVRHHLCTIFEKLGVRSRGELIVFAYRNHLVEP